MRVLCIRLTALGDMVVTTPVYRALHEQLGAEVHVLTRAGTAQMLTHNPYVAEVVDYAQEGLVAKLRAAGYALVIDLHCNARSHKLRLALGLPSVGYHKRNVEKGLLSRGIDRLGRQHLVDRYFETLAPLGIAYDGRGLDYFVDAQERADARSALAERGVGEQTFVALVIAGTHYTKRMPAELVAAVVRQSPLPTVLLGGTDVRALADEVIAAAAADVAAAPVDLVARLPLRVSCAVLAEAASVVATDTGLMHVAAALDKPIVSVWGSTAPPYGMYPFVPRGREARVRHAEVQGLGCHPCSKIGYPACPRGHFKCMREQDPAAIVRDAVALAADAGVVRPT